MKCPACHAENIDGADHCAECHTDLTDLDVPAGRTPIECGVMGDPLADLIPRQPLKITPDTTVREAIRRLLETGRNCALVVDQHDAMLGIFTERDVLHRVVDSYPDKADRPVSEFMTPDPARLRPTDSIAYGLNRMMVGDYRHVPIEKDGKALGVVSVRHILAYIAQRHPEALSASS